mmetsp:Transcript_15278/g.16981  ORF Transcript_15278/g.16981 Transcript_15278/m.16981 type:complete len:181 (+) Transcript_15278:901-1443(+)
MNIRCGQDCCEASRGAEVFARVKAAPWKRNNRSTDDKNRFSNIVWPTALKIIFLLRDDPRVRGQLMNHNKVPIMEFTVGALSADTTENTQNFVTLKNLLSRSAGVIHLGETSPVALLLLPNNTQILGLVCPATALKARPGLPENTTTRRINIRNTTPTQGSLANYNTPTPFRPNARLLPH